MSCSQELVGEEIRPLTEERRAEILATNEELAGRGAEDSRCRCDVPCPKDALDREDIDEEIEQELVFLGLIGMIDPPREEAKTCGSSRKSCGHSADHDHRRPPQDRCWLSRTNLESLKTDALSRG